MSGLRLFDYYGDAKRAYDGAREEKRVSGLRGLLKDHYGAQDPKLGAIAGLGGDAGGLMREQQGQEDRKREQLGQFAALLAGAPDSMKAGIYRRIHPQLVQIVPDAPADYTPEVGQLAQQIATQFGGKQGANTGIQSTFVDASGNRVGITRDGRTVVLGQNAPNMQILEGQGGYYGVNKGSLQAAPVTMGGQMPPQGPQQPAAPAQGTNDGVLAVANQMAQAGIPAEMIERWMAKQPGIQPVSQQEAAQGVPQQLQPAAKPVAPRAPTELERRVAMAREMGASEQEVKRLVVGGGQSGNAQAQKTGQANRIKMAQLDTVQRQIDRLAQASDAVAENAVFDGGPLDQYALKFGAQGQELEQSAAAILPVLTALTRVPGVGAQSDLESRLASLQLPSAGMHPEVRKSAVAALRAYMADLKAAYSNLDRAPAQAPAGGAPVSAVNDIDSLLEKYK